MRYLDLAGKFKKTDKPIPRIQPTLNGWLTSKTITTQYESRDNCCILLVIETLHHCKVVMLV